MQDDRYSELESYQSGDSDSEPTRELIEGDSDSSGLKRKRSQRDTSSELAEEICQHYKRRMEDEENPVRFTKTVLDEIYLKYGVARSTVRGIIQRKEEGRSAKSRGSHKQRFATSEDIQAFFEAHRLLEANKQLISQELLRDTVRGWLSHTRSS